VIVDLMMPRKGGYLVLEAIKARPDAPPVVMITANEGVQHRAYAERLGVDDYLRKPFALDRLLASVERPCPLVPAELVPCCPHAKEWAPTGRSPRTSGPCPSCATRTCRRSWACASRARRSAGPRASGWWSCPTATASCCTTAPRPAGGRAAGRRSCCTGWA